MSGRTSVLLRKKGNPEAAHAPSAKTIIATLLSISKITRAMVGSRLSSIDVHVGQDDLLLNLIKGEAVSVSELAERTSVRPSTISKTVDRLIAKGWVERVTVAQDRRLSGVQITAAGLALRGEVQRLRDDMEREFTRAVAAAELENLAEALDTVEEVLRQRLAKIR
jgi:DNA-binding MarR family transcriptional regulator